MKQFVHAVDVPIKASLSVPGSKSITNRALILASLAEGTSELENILISDDTLTCINALRELGIDIEIQGNRCVVSGCAGAWPMYAASLWCADAGTVARFLLAACSISTGNYYFDASERLRERPIVPLLQVLQSQGVRLTPSDASRMPFTISGMEQLPGGEINISSDESSQFISALLMAAPFAKNSVSIKTKRASSPYIAMTCRIMADFGVMVRRLHQDQFLVSVPQRYQARSYAVEPDFSTASYFFAAAAVTGGDVTIQSLQRKFSKQGDVRFLDVLEKMGCSVNENVSGLQVIGPAELKGVNVDMRYFSDTFMTLAATAPFASTPTTITNIGHTRLQESNRITAMYTELQKLGLQVEEGPDWLRIHPGTPKAAVINSHNDHRIAMAFAIIALRTPGLIIEGAGSVAKTCPEFFSLWQTLI